MPITGAAALVGAQLCVAIFIFVMVRALRIRDWQAVALWVLATITFAPLMGEVFERNLQVLLLALPQSGSPAGSQVTAGGQASRWVRAWH